jgi:uncharacterized protein YdcH (DUF465 family)
MERVTMTFRAFMLLVRHKQIDDMIKAEQSRRWHDVQRLQKLKKLKLSIKDRLHRMAISQGRRRTT